MADSQVTIVVVNWNLKEETQNCLRSLAQLDHPNKTIVVDNGSNDGSTEYISHHFPQIELITLPSNVGFGAACNLAISQALKDTACEYIFLLNNDAVTHPNSLSELMKAALAHPEVGIFGPKVYYRDDPDRIWYAGARRHWGILVATDTGRGQIDRGQFNTLREVDYVFGVAMLIRRSVFERIGLFDERFFLYLEDLDFCLRAQAAGFLLLFVPWAQVWHQGFASTTHNVSLRRYHKARSMTYFLRKHVSCAMSLLMFVYWVLTYLWEIVADLASGELGVIRACWFGFTSGLVETPRRAKIDK